MSWFASWWTYIYWIQIFHIRCIWFCCCCCNSLHRLLKQKCAICLQCMSNCSFSSWCVCQKKQPMSANSVVLSNGCEGFFFFFLLWWGVLLFLDDVILHHPCHIFWVAVGSSAACCSPVCCRCWDHMDPALSCLSSLYLSLPPSPWLCSCPFLRLNCTMTSEGWGLRDGTGSEWDGRELWMRIQ